MTYKRVYHWDATAGGRCTHSYSERRCHRVTEGLHCENTVNLLTCKTTLFWFMSPSHRWIWNTRRLSSGRLSHHGRFSDRDQRVQNLFYATSRATIMAKSLGVLCCKQDRRDCRLSLITLSLLEKKTRAEQHILREVITTTTTFEESWHILLKWQDPASSLMRTKCEHELLPIQVMNLCAVWR